MELLAACRLPHVLYRQPGLPPPCAMPSPFLAAVSVLGTIPSVTPREPRVGRVGVGLLSEPIYEYCVWVWVWLWGKAAPGLRCDRTVRDVCPQAFQPVFNHSRQSHHLLLQAALALWPEMNYKS